MKQKSSFKEGFLPIRYLGVPLHSKKLNKCHYQLVVDKKISFYGLNTISQAKRVELIKIIILPQLFFWFQVLNFPKEVLKQEEQSTRNFLWKESLDQTTSFQVPWNQVCQTKRNGRLGIKAMELWNKPQ